MLRLDELEDLLTDLHVTNIFITTEAEGEGRDPVKLA